MSNPRSRIALITAIPRRIPGKSAEKEVLSLFPHNPLISLDSDERIQGNPRESNP
jgi:hypothetical protein